MSGRGLLAAFVVAAMSVGANPVSALAIGDYTLPFHRNTTIVTQGYSAGHKGIDYGLGYEPVAASRQGVIAEILESEPDGGACADVPGNYALIRHVDGQYSLYFHLKQNSVSVNVGDSVSAGQVFATSGNSGWSCGPHLHYALLTSSQWWNGDYAINPSGHWTTSDPGKVPYLAAYVREHSPAGYSVLQYTTWTTWVDFRNDGGRSWKWANDALGRSRVFLDATDNTGGRHRVSSFFVDGDWETNSRPGKADADNIAPGNTARFTFQLRASSVGSFNEYFNLGALGVKYFDYSYLSGFYIPITVTHCCAPE